MAAAIRLFTLAMALSSALDVPAQDGISVNVKTTHQPIHGLGYAQAFQRSQRVYNTLSPDKQKDVLDLLHDPIAGAGFSILRLGIGSSPNSSSDWMNSIEPMSPGSPSAQPEYVWDKNDSSQVWWAQEVKKRGVNLFYGNAWSADGYMKDNGDQANGGLLCGVRGATDCPTGDWRQHYAEKLAQWVKYYKEEGIDMTHLGFANEPDLTLDYVSMRMDGYQAADFVDVLKPTMDEAGLGDIKITCCDGAGWETQRKILSELQEEGGEDKVDIITAHGYHEPLGTPYETKKEVWQTEWASLHSTFDHPFYSPEYDEAQGIVWANRILDAFTVSNVSAFIGWIGAQPADAGTIVINTLDDNVSMSKRYWAYAAFGRYVRPGSKRVEAQSAIDNVTVSAFSAESFPAGGNLALQIINNSDDEKKVPVELQHLDSILDLKAYLLNNDNDLTESKDLVTWESKSAEAMIPARSLALLVVDATWL